MPKGRYKIMTNYMPKVGQYGLDMMYRTCTVQTNLDFSSEADMVKKFRVSAGAAADRDRAVRQLAVHRRQAERLPVLPLRDLDRHRQCAHRHAALGVRGRHGLRALGRLRARRADVFRQARRQVYRRRRALVPRLLGRQAPALPGERPTLSDWADHLSTIFPGGAAEAVSGNARRRRRAVGRLPALPAFWVGLLYDDRARCGLGPRQALDRAGAPGAARRRAALRLQGPDPGSLSVRDRQGMSGAGPCRPAPPRPARPFRARRNPASGAACSGLSSARQNPAEEMLEKFHGPWRGSVGTGL